MTKVRSAVVWLLGVLLAVSLICAVTTVHQGIGCGGADGRQYISDTDRRLCRNGKKGKGRRLVALVYHQFRTG